ncbi:hypothetical protein FKW77_006825 [Venturia effusa]|uniref:Uncharacterized protein n=1 Tax=Venturia effusa TaxID=50376 RepID=A0A517LP71_9PEZI|nr:hypothetical protein FKW77_006825 [Venturia effusa]
MKLLRFAQIVLVVIANTAVASEVAASSSELSNEKLNKTSTANIYVVGSTLSESYKCEKSRVDFWDTVHAKDAMVRQMPEHFEIPHGLNFPWSPIKSGKSVAFVCTRGAFNTVSRESVHSAFGFLDEHCGKGVSGHYSWDYAFTIGRAALGEKVCGQTANFPGDGCPANDPNRCAETGKKPPG